MYAKLYGGEVVTALENTQAVPWLPPCAAEHAATKEGLIEAVAPYGIRGADCVVDDTGEMNFVLAVSPNPQFPEHVVIKSPRVGRDPKAFAAFEALIVAHINVRGDFGSLAVPRFANCETTEEPYYAMFRQVEGAVLTPGALRGFSDSEKRQFGARVGEFVYHLQQAFDYYRYSSYYGWILRNADYPPLPDRVNNILYYAAQAETDPCMYPPLAAVLRDVKRQYSEMEAAGLLRPTLIGHDDLRLANMTFVEGDGRRELRGIFDFGITKPSSPERELRFVVPLGAIATEAAIESYETVSGKCVNREVLNFWAVGQVASAFAYFINSRRSATQLMERIADLEYLRPDQDWSGVRQLATQRLEAQPVV